jgi:hypothetical protein
MISNTGVGVMLLATGVRFNKEYGRNQTHELKEEIRRSINKEYKSLLVELQVGHFTSCRKTETCEKKEKKKKKCHGSPRRVQCCLTRRAGVKLSCHGDHITHNRT